MHITLHRIYDDNRPKGYHVLVDRLWPRGISKEEANLDDHWKELAPSADLRKWFNHDADKWSVFQKKYLHELNENTPLAKAYLANVHEPLVLLYGAKDTKHTHAIVLKNYLSMISTTTNDRIECSSPPCFSND
jgi:uncharacterized protein YeaO (DUF488 family)